MKRTALILTCLILLEACVAKDSYKMMVNSWKGKDLEQLMDSWGRPYKVFHPLDGHTIVEYREINNPKNRELQQHGKKNNTVKFASSLGGSTTTVIPEHIKNSGYLLQGPYLPSVVDMCITRFVADTENIIIEWYFQGDFCTMTLDKTVPKRKP